MADFLDLPDALDRAALIMEDNARRASNDTDEDTLCCWQDQRVGGQANVIEVRTAPDGATDMSIVAVPAVGGVAEHIASAHPRAMVALTEVLRNYAAVLRHVPFHQRDTQLNRDLVCFVDVYLTDRHD